MPRGKKAPTTRSTSGSTKSTKQQSALSFGGRVTKPSGTNTTSSTKHSDLKAAALERSLSSHASGISTPVTIESQPTKEEPSSDAAVPTSELAIRAQARAPSPTPSDLAASKITDAQIAAYWKAKEAERTTPRVHQEGLSLHEKVLREFDMSSQYGPCIGVARGKRWRLAEELGLQPPIEVLGVLMKEERREGDAEARTRVQRAYVDELMSSRFVVED